MLLPCEMGGRSGIRGTGGLKKQLNVSGLDEVFPSYFIPICKISAALFTRFSSPHSGILPDSKRPAPPHTSARTGRLPPRAPGNTSRPESAIGLLLPQSPRSAHLESSVSGVHSRSILHSTPLSLLSWPASLTTHLGSWPLWDSA